MLHIVSDASDAGRFVSDAGGAAGRAKGGPEGTAPLGTGRWCFDVGDTERGWVASGRLIS